MRTIFLLILSLVLNNNDTCKKEMSITFTYVGESDKPIYTIKLSVKGNYKDFPFFKFYRINEAQYDSLKQIIKSDKSLTDNFSSNKSYYEISIKKNREIIIYHFDDKESTKRILYSTIYLLKQFDNSKEIITSFENILMRLP